MPLSEHEQRLLDEIEQALYAEDPKFASAVRSARSRSRSRSGSHRRNSLVISLLGIGLGLGLVLVGLLATVIALSVVGFVLLVAGCAYGVQSIRARSTSGTDAPTPSTKQTRASGMRTRMEDRLRRRFDEN